MVRRGEVLATALLFMLAAAGGCAPKPTVVSPATGARRIGAFDVAPPWLAYAWTLRSESRPEIGPPVHLGLRNMDTGAETELNINQAPRALFSADAGRVAYVRAAGEGPAELILREAAVGTEKTIAQGNFTDLDLGGDWLVDAEGTAGAWRIVLCNLAGGEPRELARAAGPWAPHPRVDGQRVAWTQADSDAKGFRLRLYDVATQKTQDTNLIQPVHFNVDLSGDYVVYALRTADSQSVHLYQVSSGEDHVIAAGQRYSHDPRIEGDTVVWAASAPRDEFIKVPGQPRISARDFRDICRYSISSGKTTAVATQVFCMSREAPGQMVAADGSIYAAAEAKVPGAGEHIMSGRVDVRRWGTAGGTAKTAAQKREGK